MAVSELPVVPAEEQIELLRAMLEIRLFEDEVERMFARNEIRGTTHLCQGQEAVAVGACRVLREGDTMTCTYRGHGAVLAMGSPLDRAFGEILGRAAGLCGGKGGSMHLTDFSVGALGSFGIVGAHLPIAVGAALAAWYRGTTAVSLCFFGDGSTNIGAFHEALNLAAVRQLPVIFVCENNLYGEYSPIATTTPIQRLADRADAYGMPSATIDGNDVLVVRAETQAAVERARAGDGPMLIEALTYRHKGHSRSDPASYRPEGELDSWLDRDPITLYRTALADAGVEPEEIVRVEEEAAAAIATAADRARAWPEPEARTRLEHVYA